MMKKMMERMNLIRENQKKNGKKGFSMIELIIVIAIMAILIALIGTQLLPYLEKSRKTRDLDTLSAALTAVQSTMTDYEISASNAGTVLTNASALASLKNYLGYDPTSCRNKFSSRAAKEQATNGAPNGTDNTDTGLTVTGDDTGVKVQFGNLWVKSDGTNSDKPTTNNTTTNNGNGG